MFDSIRQDFEVARDEARDHFRQNKLKPNFVYGLASVGDYFANIPTVCRLIAREPEIVLFAAAQWLVVWLAYLAWTQMLFWIPDSVWQSIERSLESHDRHAPGLYAINLALCAWSFAIVLVAAFPIGLLNAAMVAVHDLRNSGQTSTIGKSLALAERHLGRIWVFTAIDGWITVKTIFNRLPKKNQHRSVGEELLYYAWKVATMGVVPSLVAGRDYADAGRDSVKMLTAQPGRAMGLRFGYSALCWVVGIAAYAGAVVYFPRTRIDLHAAHGIFKFYFWAAWPIAVATGVVCVVLRPFFLLGVAKFFTDVFDVRATIRRDVLQMTAYGRHSVSWITWVFLLLLTAIVVAICLPNITGAFVAGLAPAPTQ